MKNKMIDDSRHLENVLSRVMTGILSVICIFYVFSLLTLDLKAQVSSWDVEDDEVEKHEVKVEAQILPFYAVDSKGEPVHDLKQEEIQVLIDKKPIESLSFSRFSFESTDESERPTATPRVAEGKGRFVFLILDSVFNSVTGLRRSKEVFIDIIKRSPPGDAFILLDNNINGGLRYVVGPTHDTGLILEKLDSLTKISERNQRVERLVHEGTGGPLTSRMGRSPRRSAISASTSSADREHTRVDMEIAAQERKAYSAAKRGQLMTFASALMQLEYALKTISSAKIVYLVSEGVPEGALSGTRKIYYYGYLEKAAMAINRGGSLLYVINPEKELGTSTDSESGKEALKLMARKGNGKYFGGSDTGYITKRLRKSTAAYYEIGFMLPAKNRVKLKVTSKRKGVKIYSINKVQRKKPYRKMAKLQKRLFALNVVTGGSWSRMVAKVKEGKYVKKGENIRKNQTFIEVKTTLPANMSNLPLDIYTINLEPTTMEADIEVKYNLGEGSLSFKARKDEGRQQYFVIIEPGSGQCLSNRIL